MCIETQQPTHQCLQNTTDILILMLFFFFLNLIISNTVLPFPFFKLNLFCYILKFESFTKKKKHTLHTVYFNPQVSGMHTSIISTREKSHPKIVLNILAVGWGQRIHLIFFVLLVVFRHLILTLFIISRLSFNGKKAKICARKNKTKNNCIKELRI